MTYERVGACQGAARGPEGEVEGGLDTPPQMLTRRQVAEWLNASESKVARMPIPVHRFGRRCLRYDRGDVERYLKERRVA